MHLNQLINHDAIFRSVLFQHMVDKHAFNVGLPDNLGKCSIQSYLFFSQCLIYTWYRVEDKVLMATFPACIGLAYFLD